MKNRARGGLLSLCPVIGEFKLSMYSASTPSAASAGHSCCSHTSQTGCLLVIRSCEDLRIINSEGQVDQRTSFIVEELFRVRRKGFAAEGTACLLLQCMAANVAGALRGQVDLPFIMMACSPSPHCA